MSKGFVNRITNTLTLLILLTLRVFPQDGAVHPVRIMFYNTENLFDPKADSISDDKEFLPESTRRWSYSRYSAKINSLGKTILAAGDFSPPAIVALCEIENRRVLEDLIYSPALAKYDYGIIHEDSPDSRGIDVALIYRKDVIRIISYRYLIPDEMKRAEYKTRSVLCASVLAFTDTITLILNHWPSRRGGVLAGEALRSRIASMVRSVSDSISKQAEGKGFVLIGGDLNSTPEDANSSKLTDTYSSGLKMINLSALVPPGQGSYKYKGSWEMIDQVFVSESMIQSGLCDLHSSFRIFNPEFLLQKDPDYPGKRPFSTYLGYRYQGGFSDHLPVILDLGLH
jgi:hypothetical protein